MNGNARDGQEQFVCVTLMYPNDDDKLIVLHFSCKSHLHQDHPHHLHFEHPRRPSGSPTHPTP
jgi:hypothetical protein